MPAPKDDFESAPPWLKKLLGLKPEQLQSLGYEPADIEAAKTEWLGTSKLAAVRKIMDAHPDLNFEEALAELNTYRTWRKDTWPGMEREYQQMSARAARAEQLERELEAARRGSNNGEPPSRGKWAWKLTPEQLYETNSLHAALDDLADQIATALPDRMMPAVKAWWEKDELPVINEMAGRYLDNVVGLMKLIWPKDSPSIQEILREATARQERDLGKVYQSLVTDRTGRKHEGFEEGYRKAQEEFEAKQKAAPAPAGSPSGPAGTSMPSWKREAPAGAPKTRDELFSRVVGDVEKRKGVVLPR